MVDWLQTRARNDSKSARASAGEGLRRSTDLDRAPPDMFEQARLLSDWGLANWGLVIPQNSVKKSAKFRKNLQKKSKFPQIDWGLADWGLVIPKKNPQNSVKPAEH